jgi:UDP-N-acetyl-D-mannosaminuronic acid dehydrogenase
VAVVDRFRQGSGVTAAGFELDVTVLGGCGRVGLPLAISFAHRGLRVGIYDISAEAVERVSRGELPFQEPGAAEPLRAALADGSLRATVDPAVIRTSAAVVVVIGTPVDQHMNPDPESVARALRPCEEHFRDGQLVVLRSTVFPGVTAAVERRLAALPVDVDVAFCPERIAEGHAMTELFELPQIVGSRTERAAERAERLFRSLTDLVVHVTPEEAELAKLFTNAWRYVKFATANQFFVMANDIGVDFERVRAAITYEYPRAADMPGPGFAAGPCLLKDTMQLAAFSNNTFLLGHSAMLVNEGLPLYVVRRLEQLFDLRQLTVGLLGMAFKAGSDDTRASLSYKLRRILEFRAGDVLCTDPHVRSDPTLLPLDEVVERSDVLVLTTPHAEYRTLEVAVPLVDIWGLRGEGTTL